MSERFECGDTGVLVAYVYEECDPELRETIAAHLSRCISCSAEIRDLDWTRRRLQAWVPPVTELGFQMPEPARSARLPWWRAPLPAWAQAAAALLIFGAGLSIGIARTPPRDAAAAAPQSAAAPREPAASRIELSELEERLRSEMAQLRAVPVPAPAGAVASDAEIMEKVEALLAESEERQRREFTLRSVELARNIEAQRRVDMASVRETVGQLQGVTGAEIRQQREAIDRLIRVSQQGR